MFLWTEDWTWLIKYPESSLHAETILLKIFVYLNESVIVWFVWKRWPIYLKICHLPVLRIFVLSFKYSGLYSDQICDYNIFEVEVFPIIYAEIQLNIFSFFSVWFMLWKLVAVAWHFTWKYAAPYSYSVESIKCSLLMQISWEFVE